MPSCIVYKNYLTFICYHMTYRVPNRNCGVRGQPPKALKDKRASSFAPAQEPVKPARIQPARLALRAGARPASALGSRHEGWRQWSTPASSSREKLRAGDYKRAQTGPLRALSPSARFDQHVFVMSAESEADRASYIQ